MEVECLVQELPWPFVPLPSLRCAASGTDSVIGHPYLLPNLPIALAARL